MRMKIQDLFPSAEPSPQFRKHLKFEVLEMYSKQRQPLFNWRWLFAPSVALASLLLFVLAGNKLTFTDLPNQANPNQTIEISNQTQQSAQDNNKIDKTQLAEKPQNLDQLDQELTELSDTLNDDSDLVAAIDFSNL